jgi:hypothetical protein
MKPKSADSSKVALPTESDTNQSRLVEWSPKMQFGSAKIDTNQVREEGMVLKSSDFDENDRINPFTQMETNPCGGHRPTGKGS